MPFFCAVLGLIVSVSLAIIRQPKDSENMAAYLPLLTDLFEQRGYGSSLFLFFVNLVSSVLKSCSLFSNLRC